MAIETPKYEVLKHDGAFEIRKYSGYLTANVEIEADDYNNAGNQAFNYLADYIFGNNTVRGNIAMTAPVATEKLESAKIAMTVPVIATEVSKDSYQVSFTMPSAYTLKTLPKPNNAKVRIKEIGPFKAAVIKFSGYTGAEKVESKIAELQNWCAKNKLKCIGQPSLARFDAPWKPGFIRHNEVGFKIK
jgi:hypothetical protein